MQKVIQDFTKFLLKENAAAMSDIDRVMAGALFEKNKQNEASAMQNYYELIQFLIAVGADESDIDEIREAIGDEQNHDRMLTRLANKYNKIPTPKT